MVIEPSKNPVLNPIERYQTVGLAMGIYHKTWRCPGNRHEDECQDLPEKQNLILSR